jgi:hypothetical protein
MAGATQTPETSKPEQGSAGKGRGAKTGRPTDYTPEFGDAICAEIAGGISLKKICEKKTMPSRQTVYTWFRLHEEFLDNYTRAKDDSADALADDIIEISQGVLKKKYDPQAARVAIDGMKWSASKLKPKKYGDKLDLTGESTVTHKFKDLDDEQLDAAISAVKNKIA